MHELNQINSRELTCRTADPTADPLLKLRFIPERIWRCIYCWTCRWWWGKDGVGRREGCYCWRPSSRILELKTRFLEFLFNCSNNHTKVRMLREVSRKIDNKYRGVNFLEMSWKKREKNSTSKGNSFHSFWYFSLKNTLISPLQWIKTTKINLCC